MLNMRKIALLLSLLFTLSVATAQSAGVRVDNVFSYRDNGFHWTVFINESTDVLKRIRCVEYTLHPTFPQPVQRRCAWASRFGLDATGWGEFNIAVKIEWVDGRVTRQTYPLDLHSRSRRDRTVRPPRS
jgi:hypothetical protein